jgi:hypothetical protein
MASNDQHRGYLEAGGKPLTEPAAIARLVGDNAEIIERYLRELEDMSVFSRDRRGCIYSRRIVKDEERSERGREHGKRGGNPTLTQKGVNPTLNPTLNPAPYPSPYPPGISEGIYLETRNQKPDSPIVPIAGASGSANGQPPRRSLTAAERIDRRETLNIKRNQLRDLESETSEQWQRDEYPEKVHERNRLREVVARIEAEIAADYT